MFDRLRKQMKWTYLVISGTLVALFLIFALVDSADGSGVARKQKLPRLDPYYEITNDGDDHGNYIELYRVPLPDGRHVFCIVYSDQIQSSGGGAGLDCNWAAAR